MDGVVVQVGDEWIFDASSNRKSASFNDGVMKPEDFGDAVADVASVYFSSDEGKLVSVGRVLPSKDAKSPRAIINELIRGPLPYENCQGVFPTGITTNDILGVRISDRAALINLSSGFYARCQNISFAQERNLVYSLVDTLCDMEAVDRVRIFINGKSADTLADFISIRTSLVANPGLAANG